jgi:rhodanese-related sulfurtransferase
MAYRAGHAMVALDFSSARGEFPLPERARGSPPDEGLEESVATVHDLTPQDVAQGIAEGRYLLVDVREPNEVAAEAYPDGVVVPLSTFDPQAIPDPAGKQVVFACRSGKRSVTASMAAQSAGLAYDKHLAGGMLGWKAAGLPTKTGG